MNYNIDFDKLLEIVHVNYNGVVSLRERLQAVEDVCDAYTAYNPLKILINVRNLEMTLTIQEQQYFGHHLANHNGLLFAKVAVLHNTDHNPNLIVDACAFNNGYRLAEFIRREEAEAWLAED